MLLLGVVAGLSSLLVLVRSQPDQVGLASDVYLHAARAVLAGENVYAVSPPGHAGYRFLYPPIVVVAFLPHAALGGEGVALLLQTIANFAASAGIGVVLWRALSRRGVELTWVDGALLVAFPLVSAHGVVPLVNGQVTHWLGLAVAAGLDALDRRRGSFAGAAFGLAALVKVFPAAIGLWLLRRRAWRAVGVAIVTGLGGLLVGAVAFGPDLTVAYLTDVLTGRFDAVAFSSEPDPRRSEGGIRRQLAALLPVGPSLRTVLSLVVLAPLVAATYHRVDTDERRLAAALGTLTAVLLFLPLQPLYFLLLAYPLVVLLYRLPAGLPRAALVIGTLSTFVLTDVATVERTVNAVPLPAGVEAAILRTVIDAYAVIQPPTVGLWLLLGACVLVGRGSGRSVATTTPRPDTTE